MKDSKLTESDKAWLCSCSSYAKVKKPELTVMATSDVAIMLHNLRFEIEELTEVLNEFVTEHCDRAGDESWPDSADNQNCPIVAKAMKLLDL